MTYNYDKFHRWCHYQCMHTIGMVKACTYSERIAFQELQQ